MDAIKITGEWRRGGNLKLGLYLYRCPENVDVIDVATLTAGSDRLEYLGPIEIVEPEPVPTPMPGCTCSVGQSSPYRWIVACKGHSTNELELGVYGDTRRQAVLRHNAAVAAIVAMESK